MGQSTNAGEVRAVTLATEKKYGLPEGTLYKIAGIESSYTSDAVSPKGAQGWFQFMPATAKEYGVTDPRDLAQSADGAGRFMRDLMSKYGGDIDSALAYYNGGHKAVKALKAGSPWAETADYLKKFHGAGYTPSQGAKSAPMAMGEQFTTQTTSSPSVGPLASDLNDERRQRDNEFGGVGGFVSNLPRATSLGFQTQNSVWNWWQERGLEVADGTQVDWDNEDTRKALATVPQRHWDYILQSATNEEMGRRMARLQDVMAKEEELGSMGLGLALTGGMVGSLPDLPTLLGFLPGAGGMALMSKASRLQNVLRMGAVGGASNLAYEAVAMQYKPTATAEDLWVAGLFGMGLGALGGGAVNPRRVALWQENQRLREFGMSEGTRQWKREIDELMKGPRQVEPFTPIPRDEWLKKIDQWAGGAGRKDPLPRIAVLRNPTEPPAGALPGAPKGAGAEPPVVPTGGPVEQPPPAPKVDEPPSKVYPNGKPWEPKWDEPARINRMGAKDILLLPPLRKISDLAQYVREKSTNKDIVAIMDRTLKNIDLRKLKFDVIDPKTDPRTLKVDRQMASHMNRAYGVVSTPYGSTGDGIQMALRGTGWGQEGTGLNEETFVHELIHVATVYKAHRVLDGRTNGMRPETVQAYKELNTLFRQVKEAARKAPPGSLPERIDVNLSNEKEFITYGLTNRPFQEWLKTVKIDGEKTTLWTRFTETLRKMLGMTKAEGHAYARLIDLTDELLEKSGIEGTSKKTSYEGGAYVTTDTVDAANAADIAPVFGFGLGLEHRLGSKKVPPKVRQMAAKLFGTTVGYKGHGVVQQNAWDGTMMRATAWAAETRKEGYAAFDAWFKESKRPWHEKGQAFDEFGEQVSNYIRGFDGEFHPEVIRAAKKIQEINAKIVDEINNPALRDGGNKRGLTEIETVDENGNPVLIGKLEKNPNYLARKHDSMKWDSAVAKFGREAVEGWWERAYAKAHPERTQADAKKWAGWYVRTVEEAHMNRKADHLEEMMSGYDEKALRESLMRNGGFSEQEAIELIKGMFQKPSSDAGRTASSLRHRNHINETHTETWRTPDGQEVQVTINDFIQSNALDVQESYYRRVASSIALANHLDIYKQSDIGRMIDDATAREFGSDVPDSLVRRMRNDLQFAVDRIQGIPQEDTSVLNKSMSMWRDFNVIRLMGGAVWNQMTELSQIAGTMGWKATLGAVKELKSLRRDIKTGKAPHDLLDHLENTIGGVGSEYVARLDFSPKDDWQRLLGEDSKVAQRLDKLDTGLKKGAKGVLDYTGMTGVMVQQKRIHAIALANHFVDAANGNPSKFLSKDRLAWMGMSEAEYGELNAAIKAYSKPSKGEYGKKWDWDFKAFAKDHPELNAKLMNALHRESRRVVQENDLASMVPIMGTTLGQTVFQFMNFVIHAWNKSMLFSLNHRDFSTFSTVMHGGLLASLAYMGRTQLSALGMSEEKRQEFLDKRMAGDQIVRNGFGKIAQMSLLPQVYDTTVGNFTGPLFSGMRTTSDLSSFASNPTLQAVNGFLSMGKIVRNGFSDETQTTERDIRTWGKLMPLNNIAPFSTLINAVANDYPYSDQEE